MWKRSYENLDKYVETSAYMTREILNKTFLS